MNRSGRAAQVFAPLPQGEQKPRVRNAGQHAVDRPEPRVRSVCALLEHARDEDDHEADDRNRHQRRALRFLAEQSPGEHTDEHDLRIAEHGREPCADELDRVVPENQIRREERACDPRERDSPAIALTVTAILEPREHEERRQRPDAAIKRAGRCRHVRQPEEDPGERDSHRRDEHGQHRPLADTTEEHEERR